MQAKEHPPDPPLACPPPTREAAAKLAQRNTIVLALMNHEFIDFGMNWLTHLRRIKVRVHP